MAGHWTKQSEITSVRAKRAIAYGNKLAEIVNGATDDSFDALLPIIDSARFAGLRPCLVPAFDGALPEVTGGNEPERKFKTSPIGYFHIDIAEVQTAAGKLRLFGALDAFR